MPEDVKRPYRSPLRAEAAQRTRAVIREAAAGLFADRGYVSTTIKDIAAAAGVAVRTVHAAYPGGKAEIFHRALDVAIGGDDEPVAVIDRPEVREALADPDRLLADLARRGAALHARAGGLLRACAESAGADGEMRELDDLGARMMAGTMRTVAESLQAHGLLAVPVEEAADVLFTLGSPAVHDMLVRRRGWPTDRYADWLERALRLLLTDTCPDGAR
ncbi:TetR/AcrR family transcriptional regulator [Pseudonocardia oroxyli]|uniref:Transcriptional regulator, TetR family n=1 Tax=Pseudonocardia oroxyli TaxID=366584 RepID=A0A1G7NPK7_PSEOR|nr:TetR/AcrR family transcriptional regulator [Pseudonocardia oroxyli]SDF75871.1 transcriptional regulator, TetR family [Pseudonocardia oroxyli]